MCRGLAYLGQPILLDDLLYKPDSSLIKQSYLPKKMSRMLNLAGFGMAAWPDNSQAPHIPLVYKSIDLPFYDKNLKNVADNFQTQCVLAHIRGVPFSIRSVISKENAHPFLYPNCKIALAHNGNLEGHRKMKIDFFEHIKPDVLQYLSGNTDSEIIYALMLSQLSNPYEDPSIEEVSKAILETLRIIKNIRKKHHQAAPSAVNLFVSNGQYLIITRFEFDFGAAIKSIQNAEYAYHSLWYTYGGHYALVEGEYKMAGQKKQTIIFSSEPLTQDLTTWIEVPAYSIMTAQWKNDEILVQTSDLDI